MGRMRAKRNIPIRMERCHERWFDDPMLNKGHWREACGFDADVPVWLEIGCGKGKFCTQMAQANPDVLYIAMEKEPSVVLAAIEKAHEARFLALLKNLREGLVFSKEGDAIWQCRNCGHIVIGKQAPDVCPVCNHPQSYFEVKAENY